LINAGIVPGLFTSKAIWRFKPCCEGKDKQVNEETAKVLVTVVPTIKEAVLSNSKLDSAWLAESLEANLKQQGAMMEKIAPDIRMLLQKDGIELVAELTRALLELAEESQPPLCLFIDGYERLTSTDTELV